MSNETKGNVDEYSIRNILKILIKMNIPKNEIIDSLVDQFNISKDDAESYYYEAQIKK